MAYRQSRGLLAWGLGAVASPAVQSALASASATSGVPLSLLQSLAAIESSNNPNAVSSKGAQGLLQLMPATGVSLGVTDPFDPAQNASAGASYLASLYRKYGDWNTALIAYNEGPGNLANLGPFSSSQTYAQSVLSEAGMVSGAGTSSDAMAGSLDAAVGSLFDFSTVDSGSVDTSGISPLLIGGILLGGLALAWVFG